LIIGLFLFGCATSNFEQRIHSLEQQIAEMKDEAVMDEAAAVGAATRIYGRIALTGGTKSVDNIACSPLAYGDMVVVIDTTNQENYFYWYDDTDSTSTADGVRIIKPQDADLNCAGAGRWKLTYGINFNSSTDGPGSITMLEDGDNAGFNYYELQAPASIATNQTFEIGKWRIDSSTLVDPSDGGITNLEVDDRFTLYIMEEDGLSTDNHTVSLPAATGSGIKFAFVLTVGTNDGMYDIRIDPDGTDRIVLTDGAGNYVYPEEVTANNPVILYLHDCQSGWWCSTFDDTDGDFAAAGNWQEE
jgi:hypothetical protein